MSTDLASRIGELAAAIDEGLSADAAAAKAAGDDETALTWTDGVGGYPVVGTTVDDGWGRTIVYIKSRDPRVSAQAQHIALHDPARVLRDVKATRALVAAILAERHDWNPNDEYYSCSQAVDYYRNDDTTPGSACSDPDRAGQPCDCGRDARVVRLLGIIAGDEEDEPEDSCE